MTVRKWNKGEGKGGQVTDHVIKEHNREDRSWLLQDSWVRRGGSKDPKLMKCKRRFTTEHEGFYFEY
jgi:hypothetical protein